MTQAFQDRKLSVYVPISMTSWLRGGFMSLLVGTTKSVHKFL